MPLEIGLWRVDAGAPVRVGASGFPLESRLEDLIQSDPTILGEPLLLIGRQVPTAYGKFIDLLAMGADGTLHILELKRDRTPRDVVAQVLDYGSWVKALSHSEVLDVFADQHQVAFEVDCHLSERWVRGAGQHRVLSLLQRRGPRVSGSDVAAR